MKISDEDIRAYTIEGEGTVCVACATNEDEVAAELDDVVTTEMISNDEGTFTHFCDRCKKRIVP